MIKKIAILGLGVMGSAIAAHIASSNLKVMLFDIVLPQEVDRNFLTKKAVNYILQKQLLVDDSFASNIEIANLEDDLHKLGQADLIIEVIIEDLALKENLYKNIANIISNTAIIASNTSTIPLEKLTANLPKFLKQNFFITHFFNPPRYMPLLELLYNEDSDLKQLRILKKFLDKDLGKTVIICNDTPGFIANRIGCYFLEIGLRAALTSNISAEEADNMMLSFGMPKTGIFGLWDLIGIDLMPLISASITSELPKSDAYCTDVNIIDIIPRMIAFGLKGRKSGQGFYKMVKNAEEKTLLSLDFNTLTYKKAQTNLTKHTLLEILSSKQKAPHFAKEIIFKTLAYAASIVPSATKSIYDIDQAMKKGYNWQFGPFELIDKIGTNELITYLKQNNTSVPEILEEFSSKKFYFKNCYLTYTGKYKKIVKEYDYIHLQCLKTAPTLLTSDSGYLVEIGDNVGCLILKNKLGVLNHSALTLIHEILSYIPKSNINSLVITSEGEHFSAGADLKFIYENIQSNNVTNIKDYIELGQQVMRTIKASTFPIVIAHKGIALGGGAELILHADFVCSHIEAQFGLVETTVGLVPGWCGIKEMLLKCTTSKNSEKLFLDLITGYKTNNAVTLKKDFAFKNVSIHMNADRLISYAKKKAMLLAQTPKLRKSTLNNLTFDTKKLSQLIEKQSFLEHQHYIANEILNIFKYVDLNKNFTEDAINNLEKELFLKLIAHQKTCQRIENFLQKGIIVKN